MSTSLPTTQAITNCILLFMCAADFDRVMKDFPRYYDTIIEGALSLLEKTLDTNASVENKMTFLRRAVHPA